MKRYYTNKHQSANFTFNQNRETFIVEEITSAQKSERGSNLIVKIQKRNISTIDMLKILEDYLGYNRIGYAGLKDKSALTTQYISIPIKFSKKIKLFSHPKMKILDSFVSKKPINIGDLEANLFQITLEHVDKKNADIIDNTLDEIMRYGIPNYFGFQRFGKESGSFEKCRDVAHGETQIRDKRVQKLLNSSYQSYLFNDWLSERIKLSNDIATLDSNTLFDKYGFSKEYTEQLKNQYGYFKVLTGDIMFDILNNRLVNVKEIDTIRKSYKEQKLIPTGLMAGSKAWRSKYDAYKFEKKYDDKLVEAAGDRRFAWVFPKKIRHNYLEKEKIYKLSFTLPRGSYATVLLEYLAKREFTR